MCGCFAASALCIWRCFTIGKLEHQINEEIRDKELRVIGADGSQLGIMTSSDALALAEEKDLDLVKIAPNAVPPVCKIMDYRKFRFEQLKKEKEAKKNQKVVEIKEIRMSPSIDTNDFNTKVKSAVKFLNEATESKSPYVSAAVKWRIRRSDRSFLRSSAPIAARSPRSPRTPSSKDAICPCS